MDRYDVMMCLYTSMRVGGPAAIFCEPADERGLIDRVRAFHRAGTPYFPLGGGTNVIVRDGGFAGAVISTVSALDWIDFDGAAIGTDARRAANATERSAGRVVCGAGKSLAGAARAAARAGLSGFETLSGIRGTVGGAVYMNAGAYEREIADILIAVRAYDVVYEKHITLNKEECAFGYRASAFKERPLLILSAEFALTPAEPVKIETDMAAYARLRNEKQPVNLPSAGSFFKRPQGDYAGRLIEAAGLKGARVGGAQISEKHAGFVVNTGGATAADVIELANLVKDAVREKFNIELEEEPVIVGTQKCL